MPQAVKGTGSSTSIHLYFLCIEVENGMHHCSGCSTQPLATTIQVAVPPTLSWFAVSGDIRHLQTTGEGVKEVIVVLVSACADRLPKSYRCSTQRLTHGSFGKGHGLLKFSRWAFIFHACVRWTNPYAQLVLDTSPAASTYILPSVPSMIVSVLLLYAEQFCTYV